MGRVEMLDENECRAIAGGQRAEELPAGFEATRRGAYSDDRKVLCLKRKAMRRLAMPIRSRPGRSGMMATAFWHLHFPL
jgi:hypothetical protein